MSIGDAATPPGTPAVGSSAVGEIVPPNPDYPVKLDVPFVPETPRIELILRIFRIIPAVVYAFVMVFVLFYHLIVRFFAVLLTGKLPRESYEFMAKYLRFQEWVSAYSLNLTDEVPPMSLDEGARSPVAVEIPYTEQVPRWRALLPWWGVFWKMVGLMFFLMVVTIMQYVMFLTILFTGRRSEGAFRFLVIGLRSVLRITAFTLLLTSERPPLWG
jgi:hypothetical protein